MKHIIIILLLIFACQDKRKEEVRDLLYEWQGREIKFPKEMIFTRFVTDTVNFTIPESTHKVLVFVDSLGCTSCKLQLHRWKEFIQHTDSITRGKVPFLFFFQSKEMKEIRYLLKKENFNIPVCLDQLDELNKLNHFSADTRFQTFLLDKDNKIKVIGNPVHNPNIRELYLKEMLGKQTTFNIKTSVKVKEESIHLESVMTGKSKKAVFELTNTGSNPLIIVDAATTCGCARVSFDKHPAKPGETLLVKVTMTPKKKGFFNEAITIKCNTNQLIKLSIRGIAQ